MAAAFRISAKGIRIIWQDPISVNPNICHGEACMRETRVVVSVILANIAARVKPEDLAGAYQIEMEDIQAASLNAAELG